MRLAILGPVEAVGPGPRTPALAPRHRAVLAYLLLHAGTVISTGRLIDAMWGPAPPDSARAQIQTTIAAIRRMLRESAADAILATRPAGYVITPAPGQLDLTEFTNLLTEARTASADEAATLIRSALALWRGEPLADITAHYVPATRARLNGQRLTAVEQLGDLELDAGHHDEIIDELAAHLAASPSRERLCRQLMLALHRAGRQPDALAVARTFRANLAEQQGLDPGTAFTTLEQDILRDEPGLRPPAPAPTEQRRVNFLPYDVPDFTGRDGELNDLTHLWTGRDDGVMTISAIDGMAGVGKTTLAVHAGHHLAGHFPDGQLFVDLQAHTAGQAPLDASAALAILLGQVGVPSERIPATLADRSAIWRSELSKRRALVVLDNALSTDHIRPLLPGTSRALVLITSRRRLIDLDGARALSMDVLPAADALGLFTAIVGERAKAEPVAVLDVLQLCGFLPLAVRIAAARLHHRPRWTVEYLATRLRDQRRRLAELNTSERGVAAAFTLSYQQLTAGQQRMFRLLGLQPGRDIGADAAAALAGVSFAEAETLLEDLLDAHVLAQHEPGRYTFHDLLREHALATATAEEPESGQRQALDRLIHHYLHTASVAVSLLYPGEQNRLPRIPTPETPTALPRDETEALTWLDTERANLVVFGRHTADHDRPADTGRLAITMHRYLLGHAHQADAMAFHELALRTSRHNGDRSTEARTLLDAGEVHYWWHGDYEKAGEHYRRALDLARDSGDRVAEARASQNLGIHAQRRRAYEQAQDHFRSAVTLFGDLHDHGGEARCLTELGIIHQHHGRYEDAHEHQRRALCLYRENGSRIGETIVLNNLGLLCRREGRHDQARRHHQDALELCRAYDFPGDEAESLNALAEAARAMGDLAQAVTEHEGALAIAREVGYRPEQARAHDGLARAHRDLGDMANAGTHARQALDLYIDLDVPEADEISAFITELHLTGHTDG
ncbi:AfsR/SARP family transcriptional regulator [Phytomonospora endophytica]|uniref:DNA-binding SARP family transcriptional activator/tetratricopeptide (TPR) repeat protein n=1 Tax=Phytomonospora endophytica TaxID=714109 RepID=A0A841FR12_9ACTN|nr:tetratricopeptide repeat protein [Phytomonospora endophytica]MBB6038625.1 DNA-binding SARP family transcriptional activator/tetratricopeptide (TPR) repeat protein [Phytomonospora endophytica]GIG69231.1 SARP family transcriptional regulator [Phytomonospora endophytica]